MKTWQLLKQNPDNFKRYFVKEYLIKACRKFFEALDYHELESPILAGSLPQERYIEVLDIDLGKNKTAYIIPTTETYNKKILAAGLGEHFVITKVCRGMEEMDVNHSPEFTMLEWYHLNANYFDLMDDCEKLFIFIKDYMDEKFFSGKPLLKTGKDLKTEVLGIPHPNWKKGHVIHYKGSDIDISKGWDRISVYEALKNICGINLEDIQDSKEFAKIAKKKGYNVSEKDDWQVIFELIFANEIETTFSKTKPTFVYNYPWQLCPLTKFNKENPLVCEKVELYLAGKEIANGYTELIDGDVQEKRFLEEKKARAELGLKPINFDHDLVSAIKSGMPDVAGIGMGLDRVAMIFADAKNIADINYFPAIEMFD